MAAGLALGEAVGAKVIEWAHSDGSDAEWTGEMPPGPDKWVGENPVTPLAGTWGTWGIDSADGTRRKCIGPLHATGCQIIEIGRADFTIAITAGGPLPVVIG